MLRGLDYEILEQSPVEYRCGCSRERMEGALCVLDRSELEEMIAEGEDIEMGCDLCGRKQIFTPQDLRALLIREI